MNQMTRKISDISRRIKSDVKHIKEELKGLEALAEDSNDFEVILNNAIQAAYLTLPHGHERYGGKNPEVGRVSISRNGSGEAEIEFTPSKQFQQNYWVIYDKTTLGIIDLRKKTYQIKSYFPGILRDIKKVFGKYLGLKEKD